MSSKLKIVGNCGYVQLFDSLQMLGAAPASIEAAPLPQSKSNIGDDLREQWRLSALPAPVR